MKTLSLSFSFFSVVLFSLALMAMAVQDFQARGQDGGKSEKAGSSTLESCLMRAGVRAKDDAARRSTKIARETVAPSDGLEHQAYLVVCEFRDGTIGFFQGGSESRTDQWVLVDKDQVQIVLDAAGRVPVK